MTPSFPIITLTSLGLCFAASASGVTNEAKVRPSQTYTAPEGPIKIFDKCTGDHTDGCCADLYSNAKSPNVEVITAWAGLDQSSTFSFYCLQTGSNIVQGRWKYSCPPGYWANLYQQQIKGYSPGRIAGRCIQGAAPTDREGMLKYEYEWIA